MYVAFAERRCKDKNNLANNVQCEPYFLQKYFFFLDSRRFFYNYLQFYTYFFHITIIKTHCGILESKISIS